MIPTYARPRFLYENFLDAATITPAAPADGRMSGASKQGTGGAALRVGGTFDGATDAQVTILLETTGDLGTATYRWRTSLTASGSWEATGQTTSGSFTTLTAGGVEFGAIVFDAADDAADEDFVEGDSFTFWCYAMHGPAKAIDRRRNTYFQTTSSSGLVFDLGSAQTVTALLVHDHNLSSYTWEANTSDSWGVPAYQVTGGSDDPSVTYPSQTYRYWRLVPVTADDSVQIGGLFVGDYLELSSPMARHTQQGSSVTKQPNTIHKRSAAGALHQRLLSVNHTFTLTFSTISNADADRLETMFDALADVTTRVLSPLWVHYFSDTHAACRLCHWTNGFTQVYHAADVNQVALTFQEVVRTRV